MSSHEKMKHLLFVATNVFVRCTIQIYDCTSVPTRAPSSFTELLNSNRKEIISYHKNIECKFIFTYSTDFAQQSVVICRLFIL